MKENEVTVEKIKPDVNGAAETMLQSFYARTLVLDELVKDFIDNNPVLQEKLLTDSCNLLL